MTLSWKAGSGKESTATSFSDWSTRPGSGERPLWQSWPSSASFGDVPDTQSYLEQYNLLGIHPSIFGRMFPGPFSSKRPQCS